MEEQVLGLINNLNPKDYTSQKVSLSLKYFVQLDYLIHMATILKSKSTDWYTRISAQIASHPNATLSDWLVLGPVLSDPQQVKNYVPKFPLFIHIFGSIACLGCSATFHLFKDQSLYMSEVLARVDYAGISLLIAGSNMPLLYYSFNCRPVHGILYV